VLAVPHLGALAFQVHRDVEPAGRVCAHRNFEARATTVHLAADHVQSRRSTGKAKTFGEIIGDENGFDS
jgi:hypothetical protein